MNRPSGQARCLTIAGSDSGGGAGIQADLKTFQALDGYGMSAITALTAQNTVGVQGVCPVDAAFVGAQIRSVVDDIGVDGVKIGMLHTAEVIEAVAQALDGLDVPVVLDPVMVATSGDLLLEASAIEALRSLLVPRATVITPNQPEAAVLLARSVGEGDAAEALLEYAQAALVKGGHGEGPESVDVLAWHGGSRRYAAPRVATRNTHGTGCTLSAALCAFLAKGNALPQAVAQAKEFLTGALIRGAEDDIGQGHGPVRWQ